MPQLDSASFFSQIFWLAIFFCAFYCFVAKSFFPNITRVLDLRKNKVANDLKAAQEANTKAHLIQQQCQQLLAKARDEARLLIIAAEREILLHTEGSLHELDQEIFLKIKEETIRIDDLKEKYSKEIKPLEQTVVMEIISKIGNA
jgi:F-type H+-transporting ATPase subunit b